jgi:hypothetical protein
MEGEGFFSLIARTQPSVIAAIRSAAADEPSDVSVLVDGDLEALRARDKSWLREFRFGGVWSALHVVVACGWREAAQLLVTDAGLDPRAEAAPFRCSAWDVAALLRDPGHDEPKGRFLLVRLSRRDDSGSLARAHECDLCESANCGGRLRCAALRWWTGATLAARGSFTSTAHFIATLRR